MNLSRHDVVFRTPVNDPTYGIPIGDGDTGALICTAPDRLEIHLNKTDLWNDADNSSDCVCSGAEENITAVVQGAVLTLDFGAPVFELLYQNDYEARLSLSDATARIYSKTPFSEIKLNAFSSNENRVTVFSLETSSSEPMPLSVSLERWGSRNLWRWYSQLARKTEAGLSGTDAFIENGRLYITQELRKVSFCVAAEIKSESPFTPKKSHSRRVLSEFIPATSQKVAVYLNISTANTVEEAKLKADEKLEKALIESEKLYQKHCESWTKFWQKSFVHTPNDFNDNLWYLNLYYANSEYRGAYPPHFCNGIWSFYHDFVPWSCYFHYNMQLGHFPLNSAGHPELFENYARFRRETLPAAQSYCLREKGVSGAFYHDVTDRFGRNADYDSHNSTPGAQIAMELYRHWKFTRDREFLENTALPVMKSVAEFYLNKLKKGDDGLFHIYGTSAYEGTPPFDDTITDIVMVCALFSALCEILPQDSEAYSEILNNLPDYKLMPMERDFETDGEKLLAGIGKGSPVEEGGMVLAVGKKQKTLEWVRKNYVNPAKQYYGFPDTELSPLYPAGVIGLKDKGTPVFSALVNQARLHPIAEGCMGWCMMPLYLARLGLSEELKACLEDVISTWIIYPQGFGGYSPANRDELANRWKLYNAKVKGADERVPLPCWDFRHFDYETLPIIAAAINESLLQSFEGVIRLFPAVAEGDDAEFCLYTEDGCKVTAKKRGKALFAEVEDASGNISVCVPSYAGSVYLLDENEEKIPFESKTTPAGTIISAQVSGSVFKVLTAEKLSETTDMALTSNSDVKRCGNAFLGVERRF